MTTNWVRLNQKCIPSQSWRREGRNQGVGRTTPLETVGKILPCLSQLLVAVSIPWLPWFVTTALPSLSPVTFLLLCVSPFSSLSHQPCVSLIKTHVIGFGVYPDDPGGLFISSSPTQLYLQRLFFQIESHSQGPCICTGTYFFEGQHSTHCKANVIHAVSKDSALRRVRTWFNAPLSPS